jgi:hydroxypyruvate isomerase
MPRFAANLSTMYGELSFANRFQAAAKDGFKGVEYQFAGDLEPGALQALLRDNDLTLAVFNAPPGNWSQGERGIASLPGREDEFRQGIANALGHAGVLGNNRLHVMAGMIGPNEDRAHHRATYLANLAYAAEQAAPHGVVIVIEPINQRDMPGYFISRQEEAQAICAEVGVDNLKVQFDLYHCQITEGDLAVKLRRDMVRPNGGIGHIQIAGVPDRHEPDVGEVDYRYLFALIDSLGYDGWVGCEYRPRGQTSEGLGWVRPWL